MSDHNPECMNLINDQPHKSCRFCEKNDAVILSHDCCVYCALKAFQKKEYKNYNAGEEHCYCPSCFHDFGKLKDIPNTEKYIENLKKISTDFICSIKGCVPIQSNRFDLENDHEYHGYILYDKCERCEEFFTCYRGQDEPEHIASLLSNEGCREHHSEGYSVCHKCAVKAYKNKLKEIKQVCEEGQEHCICPECKYDFGLLSDLKFTQSL